MRQAINNNPLVQIGLIGGLGILVALLFMTRMGGTSSEGAETPASDPAVPTVDASIGGASATPTAPAPSAPAGTGAIADLIPGLGGGAAGAGEGFVPGPGLPKAVVEAHRDGDVVAILVTRAKGIDDERVRRMVDGLRSERGDVTVFETPAADVADYSRIAQGVSLNRVPALIVLEPGTKAGAALPVATVSYGYRGRNSISQKIRDALYKGRTLPYSPTTR